MSRAKIKWKGKRYHAADGIYISNRWLEEKTNNSIVMFAHC